MTYITVYAIIKSQMIHVLFSKITGKGVTHYVHRRKAPGHPKLAGGKGQHHHRGHPGTVRGQLRVRETGFADTGGERAAEKDPWRSAAPASGGPGQACQKDD